VTNSESGRRVTQMGEDPARVFNHGSPGLDYVRRIALLSRPALAKRLAFTFQPRNLLVTFHPVTLGDEPSVDEFRQLLDALDRLGPGYGVIFTRPNADTEGRRLIAMIDAYVARRPHAKVYSSLGQELYLSTLSHVDAVVGNSSSGLYEAPSFGIPTVNIGHRQKDRLRAPSVFDTAARSAEILRTIRRALRTDCSRTVNPYGDGRSAPRIVRTLAAVLPQLRSTQKQFHWV
jgi:UDP-hydrolysing UDP-N-acetyl-D-glucosamine 2-epimerase